MTCKKEVSVADISFCVALTAYDIKLSGDHGAGLAPDGILDVIHGSDQDLSCWNLLQISNGCLDLGKHGAFLELTFSVLASATVRVSNAV